MSFISAWQVIDSAGPDAPWLTLVHGATQNRELFPAQVAAFAPGYRLLLVDLPGHGESQSYDGPCGPMEYADAVLGAIDAAGAVTTHYWGTHTGSAIGLLLGQRTPERFRSFVLEGAVIPGRQVPSVTTCYGRARTTLRERGLAIAREEWFAQSPWFAVMRARPDECRAAGHRQLLEHFQGAPWRDTRPPQPAQITPAQLSRLSVSTLLVNGEHEVPDFLPAAEELQATLPNARRVVVPEAGGFPLWEFPARVNETVAAFLSGL